MEKPITIVLVSDNHMAERPLEYVRKAHPDADYFFHCGDSELPPRFLEGFACVRGNNDYDLEMPDHLILKIGEHRILLTHGHHDLLWRGLDQLASRAKRNGCDIVCYGHTHAYSDRTVNGIRLLNPGSMRYNRDGSNPCYMLVKLEGSRIAVTRMNLPLEAFGR